jgi:hypothetical protein
MSVLWWSVIGEIGVFLPVGLHEDAVDDVDVDGACGGADGFDEAADAEIASFPQDAVGGTDDEVDGGLREGIVAESGVIEFAEDELAHGVGSEAFGDGRVGDAAFEVQIDAEVEVGKQAGPADQDEVVVLGEVFEQESQSAEGIRFTGMESPKMSRARAQLLTSGSECSREARVDPLVDNRRERATFGEFDECCRESPSVTLIETMRAYRAGLFPRAPQ